MNTELNLRNHPDHSKIRASRLPRILAVSAALGIACAAGTATAASAVAATPDPHAATKGAVARSHQAYGPGDFRGKARSDGYGDDDDGCTGLIVIVCV